MQFPNATLLAALGAWLVAGLTDRSVHSYARAAFYAGLAAWAWEELAGGVNWVRRSLGAAGLVYVVVKVGAALGASERITVPGAIWVVQVASGGERYTRPTGRTSVRPKPCLAFPQLLPLCTLRVSQCTYPGGGQRWPQEP